MRSYFLLALIAAEYYKIDESFCLKTETNLKCLKMDQFNLKEFEKAVKENKTFEMDLENIKKGVLFKDNTETKKETEKESDNIDQVPDKTNFYLFYLFNFLCLCFSMYIFLLRRK